MGSATIHVSLDVELLRRLDRLVARGVFASRSAAIEAAVREMVSRLARDRLARECAKLDPHFEQRLAEEGIADNMD